VPNRKSDCKSSVQPMNSLTTSNLTQLQLAYVTRWADGERVELRDSSLGVNPGQDKYRQIKPGNNPAVD